MNQLIAIALGGSLGALARFYLANCVYAWLGRYFPFGTLFINVSGSFLMGLLAVMLTQRFAMVVEYRAALLVGFLGAYTTFSTFALESFYLIEEGNVLKALINVFLSVLLCIIAVWIGAVIGRKIISVDTYQSLDGYHLASLNMLPGVVLGFLLAALCQLVLQRMNLLSEWRTIILLLLLGVQSISLALWVSLKLYDGHLELHTILGIFMGANLCAMLVIWFGSLFGNWLWQLNLLR